MIIAMCMIYFILCIYFLLQLQIGKGTIACINKMNDTQLKNILHVRTL